MKAETLKTRLDILSPVSSRDETGGVIIDWIKSGQVWGDVKPLNGRWLAIAQTYRPEINTKITTRYTKEITVKNRLQCGENVYRIEGIVDTDNRHTELEIMATAL